MNNSEQNSTNYHPIQDFYRHQQEVLKTHQQYLAQQMEYARAFWQVLQQFSHDSDGKLIDLPAGIQQNLQWFHHHQQETLKIHEQYLQGQSEQTQIALQWGINAEGGVPALPRVSSTSTVSETKTAQPYQLPKFEPPVPNYNPAPALTLQPPVATTNPIQPIPTTQSLAPASFSPPAQYEINLSPETPNPTSIAQVLLEIVADKTGYPTDMLETDMDLEADLGIDSIKRVEILGALQEKLPDLQVQADELAEQRTLGQILDILQPEKNNQSTIIPEDESPSSSVESATNLQDTLLNIVAEKTGYPNDMLELNMDLEADLGIDSIKRVEILGALQEKLPDLQLQADELAEQRTLGQILGVLEPEKNHQSSIISNNDSASSSEESATNLQDTLLNIVAEKTGYPNDMLELNMDLEADLGIDSIKRVEILGALQEKLPDLQVQADELAERRTLGEILETFSSDSPKKNT